MSRPESIADIIPPPDYNPDAVCFDARKREAAKDAEIAELKARVVWLDDIQTMTQRELNEREEFIRSIGVHLNNVTADAEGYSIEHKVAQVCHDLIHAESERNAWRDMAGMFGHETPVDLAGFISGKIIKAEALDAALATATTVPTDSQEPTLGFIVAAIISDQPVFATQEDARTVAISNAATTGLRASVLRIIDTVESVKVEWASDSKKSIES
jgi:hypothetical protein